MKRLLKRSLYHLNLSSPHNKSNTQAIQTERQFTDSKNHASAAVSAIVPRPSFLISPEVLRKSKDTSASLHFIEFEGKKQDFVLLHFYACSCERRSNSSGPKNGMIPISPQYIWYCILLFLFYVCLNIDMVVHRTLIASI